MVIDDTYVDRFIAERIIKKYGFAEKIILMDSTADALEYLHAAAKYPVEFPEIIFIDINMPGMDGFGFLDEYEKLPEGVKSSSSVVMLVTQLKSGDKEKAERNPYVKMIMDKPLDKEKLEALPSQPA
jgi:CheY-like chemotaxis protein